MRAFLPELRLLFLAIVFMAMAAARANPPSPRGVSQPELNPGDPVPEVILNKQDGSRLRLSDFRGQAVAVTFFYSRCSAANFCPLVGRNFASAQALLNRLELAGRCHLISISLDPEHDTPEVLAGYARGFAAESASWTFAAGPEEEIRTLGDAVGLEYRRVGDQIEHNARTIVIDGNGRISHVFRGNEWTPQELVADLRAALRPRGH